MSADAAAESIWSRGHLGVTVANITVMALAAFDGLAIVAALPSITEDLGRVSLAPWVLTSYLGVSAVAGIAAGPVIDAVGVRRTFRVTVVWFMFTSALAALAPSMELLIAARVLQGLGGGLIVSIVLSSVGLAYPEALRPRAFAANSVVWGVMGFGGPALVAGILAVADWRMMFGVQLPLSGLALLMGWHRFPSTRDRPQRIVTDWSGIAMLAVFVFAGLVGASLLGVSALGAAVAAAVLAAILVLYWRHSARSEAPVLSRQHLLRDPLWRLHLSAGLILMAALADAFLPLYAQTALGWSETWAAFTVLFVTVGWTLGAIVMSRLQDSWDPADGMALGATMIVPSTAAAAVALWVDAPVGFTLAAFFFMGASVGCLTNADLTLLQSQSEASEMGRSNSAHQFVRTMSITFAIGLSGAILLWTVDRQVGDVEVVRDVLAGEDVAVGADTGAAVADGLAWVLTWSTLLAVLCALVTWRLRSSLRSAVGHGHADHGDEESSKMG